MVEEIAHCSDEAADISRIDALAVDKDDAVVLNTGLRPGFQQRRNGAEIVCDERQLPYRGRLEHFRVRDTEVSAILEISESNRFQARSMAWQLTGHSRRNVLVQKQTKHDQPDARSSGTDTSNLVMPGSIADSFVKSTASLSAIASSISRGCAAA